MIDSVDCGKGIALVLLGGEKPSSELMDRIIERADVIICADSGAELARDAGVMPDLIVGDMDSISPIAYEYFASGGAKLEHHSANKNETDGLLALERAAELSSGEIVVLGGFGGRLDHALANIMLIYRMRLRGRSAVMMDGSCLLGVFTGRCEFKGAEGDTLSVFPLSDGVTLDKSEGLEYPYDKLKLEMSFPIAISNRLTSEKSSFIIENGYAAVILFTRV